MRILAIISGEYGVWDGAYPPARFDPGPTGGAGAGKLSPALPILRLRVLRQAQGASLRISLGSGLGAL
jgi:hypothetical protein